ncbi:unnamed protein product [marine sediment metagenome]|uniref:Uncharacterized protein n=1 Tax=marine sediment metagenome TaxID=412755 RepID=X0T7D9_9ZZZZ
MTVQQALRQSVEELRARAEAHGRLLARAMGKGETGTGIDECPLMDCPHRRRLRETLVEAITVLEGTRKAFKSKQLEALRRKLIGVLAEDA